MLNHNLQSEKILIMLGMLVIISTAIICDIIFIKANVYDLGFVTTFGLALTPSIGAVGANKGIASKKEHKSVKAIQFIYKFSLLLPYIPLATYVIKTSSFVH